MSLLEGKAWKYGDNINTDIISPAAYMEFSIAEAAPHTMSPIDETFGKEYRPGDIFVAGHNLGSGSSRETAPLVLKELGVGVIIAKSYARIFYRNCINVGILTIECQETDKISKGDVLAVDYEQGIIFNKTTGEQYVAGPIPAHIAKLVAQGGLIPYLEHWQAAQQG
ncbi:MAG TPA: 3-isopropylmalate dehydratase [Candidatus Avacidaminococcus intestinavium]|uniref:3-isopropylmalate dehydratase small subunit n=1 Tax=Candidatus Avacidaminococcus intestinavium TaxID=2840684 RepID=A0A9D1SKN0_9FIRM|nr:3-isopropylmalate dehydratase [Candidatus Avacidaminococcus intestinavium]